MIFFLVLGLGIVKGYVLVFYDNDFYVYNFSLIILCLYENDFFVSLEWKWWESKSSCLVKEEICMIC